MLLYCLCIQGSAQKSNIDSLKISLSVAKDDTIRAILLTQIGIAYRRNEASPLAFQYANEALTLSRKIKYPKGEAMALTALAYYLHYAENYTVALEYFYKSQKIDEEIDNQEGIADNLNGIANIFMYQQNYFVALRYKFASKEIYESIHHERYTVRALLDLGELYTLYGKYDSAMLYLQQAESVAIRTGNNFYPADLLSNLANVNFKLGRNEVALAYWQQSVPFTTNLFNLTITYYYISKLFQNIKTNDSAIYYLKKSIATAQQINAPRQILTSSRSLSEIYGQVSADSAYKYLSMSMIARDSIYNLEKLQKFQNISFAEQLRQQDIAAEKSKAKEERKNNLQYAAIALGLITFIILFLLLSHSIVANQKLIKFLGILGLLVVFELINLYIHPYLGNITHHSPLLMLTIMVCIAALLIPIHHWLEKWITHKLVEKNKKIRLAAAKKTIEQLER